MKTSDPWQLSISYVLVPSGSAASASQRESISWVEEHSFKISHPVECVELQGHFEVATATNLQGTKKEKVD